eukprot:8337455-Pyramimonas_sp.AAC.2
MLILGTLGETPSKVVTNYSGQIRGPWAGGRRLFSMNSLWSKLRRMRVKCVGLGTTRSGLN